MNLNAGELFVKSFLFVLMACLLTLASCKGPHGPEGPQGIEGPQGPIGPAGEDGSVMYAGEDAPAVDVGENGDYYLNKNTGELYGPKDSDGWGNPIIVLMGEDGKDGSQFYSGSGSPDTSVGVVGDFYIDTANQNLYGPKTDSGWGSPVDLNGEDGQDGEDGSQIYSGSGIPDASTGTVGDYYFDTANKDLYGPKTDNGWGTPTNLSGDDGQDGADGENGSQIYAGTGTPDASLGVEGDYYLDKSSYELYGPKTNNGWGTPLNLKGADGNANVT